MPFRFEAFRPDTGSIAESMMAPSRARAAAMRASAAAQAQGEQYRGQNTAALIGSLGRIGTDTAQMIADAPLQKQRVENATLQNTALREEARGRQMENAITPLALVKGENGVSTYDRELLTREFHAAGIGDRLPKVLQGLDAADAAAFTVSEAKREALAGLAYGVMAAGNTPQAFNLALQHAVQNGIVSKEEVGKYVQAVGDDPSKIGQVTQSLAMSSPKWATLASTNADRQNDNARLDTQANETERHNKAMEDVQRLTTGRQEAAQRETARHNSVMERIGQQNATRQAAASEPLEAIIGDDGKSVLVPRSQAVGKTPATTRERTSEDERKSVGFYSQMRDAIVTLDAMEDQLTEKELYQIQSLPQEGLIGLLNRGEMSEAARRYIRAFEQFTEARLRPVSGAAIGDTEFARDRRTYAKQFNETPALNQDRRRARES